MAIDPTQFVTLPSSEYKEYTDLIVGRPLSGVKSLYTANKGIPKGTIVEETVHETIKPIDTTDGDIVSYDDPFDGAIGFKGDWVISSDVVLTYLNREDKDANFSPLYTWEPADLFAAGDNGGWWDFSDTSMMYKDIAQTQPVTADGDNVAVVQDKSGASRNLVSTDAINNPLWDASTNSVSFNNSDPLLQNDNALWGTMHTSPFTVAILFAPGQSADPNSLGIVLANLATASSSGTGYYFAYDDRASSGRNESVLVQVAKGSLGNQSFLYEFNNEFPAQSFNSAIHSYDPSLATSDPDYSNFYKNNSELSPTFSVVNGGVGATQSVPLAIGDLNGAGGLPYSGKISQVVVIDRLLTAQERGDLENYFQNKLA